MELQNRISPVSIRSVVQSFGERRAQLKGTIVTTPLPARPDQFIEIYLAERFAVSHDDAPREVSPEIVVVGPQDYRRTRLFMSGDISVFTIRFQPGGFNAVFGIDMASLVNEGITASDILGAASGRLRDAILAACDFEARVAAAERWIWERMIDGRSVDVVAQSATLLAHTGGRMTIEALARGSGLSDRQFTRRFTTQVGLPPKLYGRIVRFNAVLAAKAAKPEAAWTDLVYGAGYADQSHFIRDSHAFSGDAPARFFAEWSGVQDGGFVQSAAAPSG